MARYWYPCCRRGGGIPNHCIPAPCLRDTMGDEAIVDLGAGGWQIAPGCLAVDNCEDVDDHAIQIPAGCPGLAGEFTATRPAAAEFWHLAGCICTALIAAPSNPYDFNLRAYWLCDRPIAGLAPGWYLMVEVEICYYILVTVCYNLRKRARFRSATAAWPRHVCPTPGEYTVEKYETWEVPGANSPICSESLPNNITVTFAAP